MEIGMAYPDSDLHSLAEEKDFMELYLMATGKELIKLQDSQIMDFVSIGADGNVESYFELKTFLEETRRYEQGKLDEILIPIEVKKWLYACKSWSHGLIPTTFVHRWRTHERGEYWMYSPFRGLHGDQIQDRCRITKGVGVVMRMVPLSKFQKFNFVQRSGDVESAVSG
jgi:hypothetical protein